MIPPAPHYEPEGEREVALLAELWNDIKRAAYDAKVDAMKRIEPAPVHREEGEGDG